MSSVEADIRSTPAIMRRVLERVDARGAALAPLLTGPLAFLGCGSSHCIGVAMADLYEEQRGAPAQAIIASQYRPRPGWMHLAISRTGRTTELIDAMRRVRRAGARAILIGGDPGSPGEALADAALGLEFAPEQGIIQTRFITAASLAIRMLIDGADTALRALPDQVERGLATFDPAPLAGYEQIVFLGRDWRYGLAQSAALNLQETALVAPAGYQTLDYRHGPIACADAQTLVWCLDPADDTQVAAVLDDVRQTGAAVRHSGDDPLVALAQAQLLAVRIAQVRGIDPDAPRHLSRAIVLPNTEPSSEVP